MVSKLAELFGRCLEAGRQYNEPSRRQWHGLDRESFITGQLAVLRDPNVHRRPQVYFGLAAECDRKYGSGGRNQFRAGSDWELQDLLEARDVLLGRLPPPSHRPRSARTPPRG